MVFGKFPPPRYDRLATTTLAGAVKSATILLGYREATDVAAPVNLLAATYTSIGPQLSFTSSIANRHTTIALSGSALLLPASNAEAGLHALIDGTTRYYLGGNGTIANGLTNVFAGVSPLVLTNLGVGAHTVQLQVISNVAAPIYLRAATQPAYEGYVVTVTEW